MRQTQKGVIGTDSYQKYAFDLRKNHLGIRAGISDLNSSFPLHSHDHAEFEMVVSGKGTHILNGHEYSVQPGDFWGLDLGDLHFVSTERLVIYTLKIFPEKTEPIISELLCKAYFPFTGTLGEKVQKRVLQAFETVFETSEEKSLYADMRSVSCALMILSDFLENSSSIASAQNSSQTFDYVKNAIDFMKEHFRDDIDLSSTAEAVGISECYLSDIFTKYAGCRFVEYLNRLRVQNVQSLLLSTNRSVTDIAFASGFGSISQMNRCFLKIFGLSPREYRRDSLGEQHLLFLDSME